MTNKSLSFYILIAFLVSAVSGAVFGAFVSYRLIEDNRSAFQPREETSGTLRETIYTDEESATIDVVEKVNPAVVSVIVKKDISRLPNSGSPFYFDNFWEDFPFQPFPNPQPNTEPNPEEPEFRAVGGGSGFIVEADGLIVTNRHVVDDETARFSVVLADGTEHEASVVAKDPVFDVAFLHIDAENLPIVELGNSDSLKLGQTVIAIGNALSEFGNTVTRGVVSGINRRVEAGDQTGRTEIIEQAIQTDAAINPGNSGGPLVNLAGQVVGINTAVSQQGQLIGFAIPINSVKKIVESVRETGEIARPWLGVRYVPITPRLAEQNNLSVTYGALVLGGQTVEELAVIPGSPADEAGIEANDIILEVNGVKLEHKDSLSKEIAKYDIGQEIPLKILDNNKEKTVTVRLKKFPGLGRE